MMHFVTRSLLVPATALALIFAAACASEDNKNNGDDDDDNSGGTAGTGGSGPVTGMCDATAAECPVMPSNMGWVDMTENNFGVQGSWYPYGDQYGAAKCTGVGMHAPADCSTIFTPPPPPAMGFANEGGKMCTTGEVAVIQPCMTGVTTEGCPDHDYSNQWGAGIGFDVNANKGPPDGDGVKKTWDPAMYGFKGFSFVIDKVPGPKLRVEIPIVLTDEEAAAVGLPSGATTDDHPKGAPYWDATSSYGPSPVQAGMVNVVTWDRIKYPVAGVTFEPKRMLGVQFHVPAVSTAPKVAYDFCISDFKLIR